MFWFFVAIFETATSTSDLKEKNTSEKLEACVINNFIFWKVNARFLSSQNLDLVFKALHVLRQSRLRVNIAFSLATFHCWFLVLLYSCFSFVVTILEPWTFDFLKIFWGWLRWKLKNGKSALEPNGLWGRRLSWFLRKMKQLGLFFLSPG